MTEAGNAAGVVASIVDASLKAAVAPRQAPSPSSIVDHKECSCGSAGDPKETPNNEDSDCKHRRASTETWSALIRSNSIAVRSKTDLELQDEQKHRSNFASHGINRRLLATRLLVFVPSTLGLLVFKDSHPIVLCALLLFLSCCVHRIRGWTEAWIAWCPALIIFSIHCTYEWLCTQRALPPWGLGAWALLYECILDLDMVTQRVCFILKHNHMHAIKKCDDGSLPV